MKLHSKALVAAAGLAAFALSPANAYEAGYPGWQTKPGAFIGSSAGVPPPGIYMFNQLFTYQSNLTGPGTTALGLGNRNSVQGNVDVQGFLFVPGWTFLGATYDALIVQPFEMASFGQPLNVQVSGVHNTYQKKDCGRVRMTSLNCLLACEQQLFVQEIGMLSSSCRGRFAGET